MDNNIHFDSGLYKAFFNLLKFSLGQTPYFTHIDNNRDWSLIYSIAEKQGIIGILYTGLERLDKGQGPKGEVLMRWIAHAQTIRNRNVQLFRLSADIVERFGKDGFRCCILKGQGLALLYPNPYMRTPGDIDVWVSGGRRKLMEYVEKRCPSQTMRYHHVDFPVMKEVPVEVHFTPSYMNSPMANAKMQKWFERLADLQYSNRTELPDGLGEIAAPTLSFNLVYILSHLYRHVFSEGIGLRQLLDYYYVLTQEDSQENRIVAARSIERLGMKRFARAVMYIMVELFGMDKRYLLFESDEREGKFLIEEVLIGGNFGQYDMRLGDKTHETVGRRWLRMSVRNMRFVRHYPSEALCEPLFRTWFWMWKRWNNIGHSKGEEVCSSLKNHRQCMG